MPLVKGEFSWETDESRVFTVTAAYFDISVVPRLGGRNGWQLASATQLHEMSTPYASLKLALEAEAAGHSYHVFIDTNDWDEVSAGDKGWIMNRFYVFVGGE